MRAFYCDQFVLPLPPEHRFPMAKYRRLRRRVLADGSVTAAELGVPDAATDEQLLRVHTRDWVERVIRGALTDAEVRRLGFPWSPQLVERSRRSVGGTVAACRAALEGGVAVNLAGGTHHAFADRGEGYCVFNDGAVAARAMRVEEGIGRVLVVDCDVHQGNGTAAIFVDDPDVFTLSIHGRRNYPFRKQRSDLDVALEDGVDDERYLGRLLPALQEALERSRPELVVYLSGADPYRLDRLGRLSLTRRGLRARDRVVVGRCRAAGAAVAVTMGGGYCPDLDRIVDIHAATVAAARECRGQARGAELGAGSHAGPR